MALDFGIPVAFLLTSLLAVLIAAVVALANFLIWFPEWEHRRMRIQQQRAHLPVNTGRSRQVYWRRA